MHYSDTPLILQHRRVHPCTSYIQAVERQMAAPELSGTLPAATASKAEPVDNGTVGVEVTSSTVDTQDSEGWTTGI